MIVVYWESVSYYKSKNKSTMTARVRRYNKIFGCSEKEKAEKFVKQKASQGFNARII